MTVWQRRDRSTDLAAVLLLVLARVLLEAGAGAAAASLCLSLALALLLFHRDRELVRDGAGLRVVRSTWLGLRLEAVEPVHVTEVVYRAPPGAGGSSILLGTPGAQRELEHFRLASQRPLAEAAARSLSRVLELPLRDEATGAVWQPEARARALRLMAAIAAMPAGQTPEPGLGLSRAEPGTPLSFSRAAYRVQLLGAWLAGVGGWLWLSASTLATALSRHVDADLQSVFDLARWLLGALLISQGFRSLLPGAVRVSIEREVLRVERRGLARELKLQLPLAALTGMGFSPRRSWWQAASLRLEFDGLEASLSASDLGLREAELPGFCRLLGDAVISACRRQTAGLEAEPVAAAPSPVAGFRPALPTLFSRSPVVLLATRFPYAALLLALACVLETFALRNELDTWLAAIPTYLVIEAPHVGGLLVEGLVRLGVVLVPGALVYAALKVLFNVPQVLGPILGLAFFLVFVPSSVPLVSALGSGGSLFRRADICLGAPEQPVHAELVADDRLRFTRAGESFEYQAPQRRNYKETFRIRALEPELAHLVEVEGFLGGRYVTVAGAREKACALPVP